MIILQGIEMKEVLLMMNEISEKINEMKILKIITEIMTNEIQIAMNEKMNEMKNEINDQKVEMDDEMDDEIDESNEKVVNLKKKSQILRLLLKIMMSIYHKILKYEKQWVNNLDLLKSIHHFWDIMLNEKNHILIERLTFGLKGKLFLH
jgi:hypothetical protein